MIVVQGHTLAGMAAAARLARLGHDVALVGDETPRRPLDHFELPAAWRDLFKKSGQPLTGALNSLHLELVPAPATTYVLPCGTELTLPDDRASQFAAITETLGRAQAERWRDLLDDLDDVWAARRRLGLERPARASSREDRRALWLDRTLADVAARADRMAPIVLAEAQLAGTDSPDAPGLLAVRQVVVRTFGRHRLVHDDGTTADAAALVTLLERRLRERGVAPEGHGNTVLDARVPRPRGWWRRPRPALVPAIREGEPGAPADVVDLTGAAPVRTIRGEHHTTVLDHTDPARCLEAGLAPDDARRWTARPVADATHAGADTAAGGEEWAELMAAALAVYDLHERLTGEDCRPTNRAFVMPRIAGER